jgi:hypothetical protein
MGTAGAQRPLIVRLSFDGSLRFARVLAGVTGVASTAVITGEQIVVGGSFEGRLPTPDGALASNGTDGFLLGLDLNGDPVWVHQAGHSVAFIAADTLGRVRIAGHFENGDLLGNYVLQGAPQSPNRNLFAAALEAGDGEILWANPYTAATRLEPQGLSVTSLG